jgi:hypothetical protein
MELSRRDFVKCAGAAVAASASLAFPPGSEAAAPQPEFHDRRPDPVRGRRPNFLIILCDQMRFPSVYESDTRKAFRRITPLCTVSPRPTAAPRKRATRTSSGSTLKDGTGP